jgi:alpha-tubulin suppressor-like RCC1 family protein
MQEIRRLKTDNNIILLSIGYEFCVCVCEKGVFSWGKNDLGQLGIGHNDEQWSYQPILFFKNPESILSIGCGIHFCICICKNGMFSWGANELGQLGIGKFDDYRSSPQPISFFKNPEDIISLSCGYEFSICLCKNGVYSWGYNEYGQLGIENLINQSSPQRIEFFKNPEDILSLSCGGVFCICIYKNGVYSWGHNKYGQLGIRGIYNYYSYPQPISFFKNPEDIISLSCGHEFSICIYKNEVYSWGNNYDGQLGIGGMFNYYSSPQKISFFQNPEDIISFSCGQGYCICICKNGVFGWGNNSSSQLGNGIYQSSPQLILFPKEIDFSDLYFPQSSIDYYKRMKILLLILAREYMDPEEYLMGKDYLPWDIFNLLLKLI